MTFLRKRLQISLVCILILLIAVGCGKKKSGPCCEVDIDDVFICGSFEGDILVVNFTAENKSDEVLDTALISEQAVASLDGETLSKSYALYAGDNPYALPINNTMPIGESVEGQVAWKIDNYQDGDVDICFNVYTFDGKDVIVAVEDSYELEDIERLKSQSDYEISVNGSILTDDGKGTDLLIIQTTFTNSSKETKNMGSFDTKAFQNGVQINHSFLPYNHPLAEKEELDNQYKDIQPDNSIDVWLVYELKDTESPVELTAVDYMSFDQNKILDEEINPKEAESVDTSSEYSLVIDTAVVGFEKYSDDPVILIMGEFTNNSSEPKSFSMACGFEAAQGGYEMERNYLSGAYSFNSNDIAPGKSIPIFLSWKLNDARNDVEIKIVDNNHYAKEILFEQSYSIDELIKNTEKLESELDENSFKGIEDEEELKVS